MTVITMSRNELTRLRVLIVPIEESVGGMAELAGDLRALAAPMASLGR
jgi:hypothetical protein